MDSKLYSDPAKGTYACFIEEEGIWSKLTLEPAQIPSDSVSNIVPPSVTRKNLGTILIPVDLKGLVEDKDAMNKVTLNFAAYCQEIPKSRGKRKESLRQKAIEVRNWLYYASCAVAQIKPVSQSLQNNL